MFHHIHIKPKDPTKLLTGTNTLVLVDGVPLKGVMEVNVHVAAQTTGFVTIKMAGSVEVEGDLSTVGVDP